MNPIIEKAVCLLMIAFGLFVFRKPKYVSEKLKAFYSQYPLVRYAGERQHTSRPVFLQVFGLVFIIMGITFLFIPH